jgi:nucleotide-binding universal stress UspA family protein
MLEGELTQFHREAMMAICKAAQIAMKSSDTGGVLLYVTDLMSDSQDLLDFACELAERHGARLELLHVIDPEQTPSMPDAQMDNQYRLETLACSLQSPKMETRAVLLFGDPEDVIWKRAADIKAKLIALPSNGSATERAWKALARRLKRKCVCPVLSFSHFSVRRMRSDPLQWMLH